MKRFDILGLVTACATLVTGCTTSPTEDELAGESADDDGGKADGTGYYGYFAIEAFDPPNGNAGYHVSMVNRSSITCGDDTKSPECFVEAIDWSATAFPKSVADSFERSIGRGQQLLLQGDIMEPYGDEPRIMFGVNEVWLPGVDTTDTYFVMDGIFVMAKDNGRRCVVAPCSNIDETRLNANRKAAIDGIKFDASGADQQAIELATNQLTDEGVIVVGDRYYSRGAKGRTANQFFTKAPIPSR